MEEVKNWTCLQRKREGSVSLEASCALTVFLFFFLSLMAFYNVLMIEMRIQNALEQTADTQSAWAVATMHAENENKDSNLSFLKCTLDQLFTRSNVTRMAGKQFLDNSYIKGGCSGIDYGYSRYLEDGEYIDLIAVYRIKIPYLPIPDFKIVQMARRRVWFGYDLTGEYARNKVDGKASVYVTPNGSAYHLYEDCSYIDVKLHAVNAIEVSAKRNENGGKYYPCESCKPDCQGTLFISAYGTRYHCRTNCTAIEKDARKIPAEEIGGRHLCSRCEKRQETIKKN